MKHLCSTCRNMALRHACTDRIWHNNGGSMSFFAQNDGVVTACPEYVEKMKIPDGWTKTEKGRLARQSWCVIRPDGSVLVDSHFKNEANAWQVALGWPDDEEIEEAKAKGYRAAVVTIIA